MASEWLPGTPGPRQVGQWPGTAVERTADCARTHGHSHTPSCVAFRQTHRQICKQQTRLHILCCMTQRTYVTSLSECCANLRYMVLLSVRTIFHVTWTYCPYIRNFTVHGLTVRTYQISRYMDLPSVHTKFHGMWNYRPYIPTFTVRGLTVHTYQT